MQSSDGGFPGVILAGGQGRRIGGGKARVLLAGRPLWRHVADRLRPQVGAMAVNGPGGFDGLPVIADARAGQGPLAGILAAMDWAAERGAARVLCVPVDTPFLPRDLALRLGPAPGPVAMARSADGVQGAVALWDAGLADALRAALAQGTRKVTDFARAAGLVAVEFPDALPPPFFNVNTPEDLARAEAWLS